MAPCPPNELRLILLQCFSHLCPSARICDRYGAYNSLPLEQRQFCWAHIRRDLITMAERSGVSAEIGQALLSLQRQLFTHWHEWLDQQISRAQLEAITTPIRQAFGAKLEWAIELGSNPGETTPLARTADTCRSLRRTMEALWTFLIHPDLEPTNNASEQALRSAVIARKMTFGVQSEWGGQLVARLLTVTTSLEQQGRDALAFLMELFDANRENRPLPSLIPQTGSTRRAIKPRFQRARHGHGRGGSGCDALVHPPEWLRFPHGHSHVLGPDCCGYRPGCSGRRGPHSGG